ncbi:MAG: hypothetical protein K2Y39_26495 [Candidatus Obscuribacterales bacterium]|nr:hypothetical protein [Candidatus Obscuribacterales bacterium]
MSEEKRVNRTSICGSALLKAATVVMLFSNSILVAAAAGPVNETALRNAWALYTQQKYRESADAFEALIASSTPSARLYYYAALSLRACNRNARAKQLCQYISTNFPSALEASFAAKLFPDAPSTSTASSVGTVSESVPPSLKGKSTEELLKTEEGRKYVAEQIAKKESASGKHGGVSPMMAKWRESGKPGARVFSAAEIAKEGANGIDQMYYPNCWFESTMSTLASLPRGQRLMAEMVSFGPKEGTYVVRFPGDGKIYNIDEKMLEEKGIHNKALWATLIECGQVLKFPEDNGNLLSEGLACLTGQKAQVLDPDECSDQELSSFIDGAVKSQNPIICGSNNYAYMPRDMSLLVEPSHAYTIIGFDPASGLIKLRNPHGANSRRFALKSDPRHEKFEMLDDGVFKIHMSLFKQYFSQVARANI